MVDGDTTYADWDGSDKVKEKHKICVVLMPFGTSEGDKYNSRLRYENGIVPAVEQAGLKPVRVDIDSSASVPIRETVQTHLKTAPMAVADLTGNNPNVFFELGFRVASGLPFVCIADAPSQIAFWGQTWNVLDYVSDDAVAKIARAIRADLPYPSVAKSRANEISNTIADLVTGPRDYFVDWLMAMRLRTVQKQIETIREGRWVVHAWHPSDYVARVFTEVMVELRPDDAYDTVTNPGFWSDAGVGASAFLRANVEAAEKGVKIRRLFLVDSKALTVVAERDQIVGVLKEHGEAAAKVPNLEVAVLLCDDYRQAFATYGHCAVLRIGSPDLETRQPVLIIPHHDNTAAGGGITRLEISFDTHTRSSDTAQIQNFEGKFDTAWGRGKLLLNAGDVLGSLGLGAESVPTERKLPVVEVPVASESQRS